jgi:hypothetical protein
MGIVQYPVDCDCGDTIWIGQWSEPHKCKKCGKTWVAYDKIRYTEVKEIIKPKEDER